MEDDTVDETCAGPRACVVMITDPRAPADDTMHFNMQYAVAFNYDFAVFRCPDPAFGVPRSDFTWNLPGIVRQMLPQYEFVLAVYNKVVGQTVAVDRFWESTLKVGSEAYAAVIPSDFLVRTDPRQGYSMVFRRSTGAFELLDRWAKEAREPTPASHNGLHELFMANASLANISASSLSFQTQMFVAPQSSFEPWISDPTWSRESFADGMSGGGFATSFATAFAVALAVALAVTLALALALALLLHPGSRFRKMMMC